MRYTLVIAFLLLVSSAFAQPDASPFSVELPEALVADIETELTLTVKIPATGAHTVTVNGVAHEAAISDTGLELVIEHEFSSSDEQVVIRAFNAEHSEPINPIPLWLSILPPLIAIGMALLFREVLSALLIGIFSGTAIIGWYAGGLAGVGSAVLAVIDTYIIESLENWDHLAVILFSMTIGAIVAVISKNGGMRGVVNIVSRYARTPKSGQLATWVLGVAIFFDDYANTLVVGNTMRAVTDRLRISREKLAYLVDSTAAPIAAIALVTTWIGFELGQIGEAVNVINADETVITRGVYSIFLGSLQYSFYPIFTLAFMLFLVLKNRDFGPMYHAEVRTRTTGRVSLGLGKKSAEADVLEDELDEFEPKAGTPQKAINAIIPILVIILGTVVGLFYTGWDAEVAADAGIWTKLSAIIGNSNSYVSLLWSSAAGLVVALLLTTTQRILSLYEAMDAVLTGFKTMLPAVIILVLAWSLAMVTEHLHTADFLTGVLAGNISAWLVPALTFIMAALVAFSTGSSWSTMAILYPIMLPASWEVCMASGYDPAAAMGIFLNVTSAVLAGSVLGDHCSPISDTTILSSLASSCNHIDHVRTQLPYALTVGAVALLVGTIPAALGMPGWVMIPIGIAALYGIVMVLGKPVPDAPSTVEQ